MKKVFVTLLAIFAVVLLLLIDYNNKYFISDDINQLQENIKIFVSRSSIIADNVDIQQVVNIDNKKYVLFLMNDTMGSAELTKGFNNKYKIYSVIHGGSGYFRGYIYKTNKAKYLIVYGKKQDMKISYVKVTLENKEYKIDIPKEEYYLVYCKVPKEIKITFPEMDNYKFYDLNDVDIFN